jgi:tagatose-1,6-bisphosphate aldolase
MTQMASAGGVIAVAAIDHRGSLQAMLERAAAGRPVGFDEMVAEKLRMRVRRVTTTAAAPPS